jgi:5-methylcytosine-specific restriction endonuclease McrA
MKKCTTCNVSYDISFFNKDKQKKDGLNPRCKECSRSWNKKNKERVSEYNKLYYEKNIEYQLSRAEKYREENRELLIEKKKKWNLKNKDKSYKYRKDRSEIYAAHARNRRARIMNNGGTHTAKDIEAIMNKQCGCCAFCKSKLKKYHVDHIYPLAKGGSNAPENLQVLCPKCNMSKNDSDPIEYAQKNGFLL